MRGHSVFSSPPQRPMTSDFEWFLFQILSITLLSYLILVLIYYFINTSTPGRRSPKFWHTQIHVNLFKCLEQTHASIFAVKSHIMRMRYHFDATMLIHKHFAVFLKTIHTEDVHHRNLCKAENGDVRRRRKSWNIFVFILR